MCAGMWTHKLQRGNKTVHAILVPLKVWIQICIELIGPLKEIDSYGYIATAVDYMINFDAEPLKKKTG